MNGVFTRAFSEGDEPAIVELFNSVYSGYGGFVPRTVEYWRWCCLERPDVRREGVFLAFNGDRFCGYLVTGSSGNIWEFCVADDNREVTKALLNEAENYLREMGVASIEVNVPSGVGVAEGLREAGFSELPAAGMFVTTLNPAVLVQILATPQRKILLEKLDEEFGVRLHDVPYGVNNEFSVKIHNTTVEVAGGSPSKPSVVVELRFMDLLSILFGNSSPSQMLLTGKIKVRPLQKLGSVLTFLSRVRLNHPWFFPLSDYI